MKKNTQLFVIKSPEDLGQGWMNKFNLEICLFSDGCIGKEVQPNIEVEEVTDTLIASEAIYAFTAWLTTRPEITKLGATEDCSIPANLIKQFCEENNFVEPRDEYHTLFTMPK